MLGIIILILLSVMEVGFMVYSLLTKNNQKDKKSITKIALFILISALALLGIIKWSFRWYILFFVLLVKTLTGIWYLLRRKVKIKKTYKKKYAIISCIGNVILMTLAVLPAIIFPQFQPIEPTGKYEVKTVSYTLTDPNRIEIFSDNGENRKITIQFWYPENGNDKYPLAVFSHGAYGFRGCNRSTFEELASNGYVVCSIDHTYQAFVTKQTDGKTILANKEFLNNIRVLSNNQMEEKKVYELSREWMKLKTDDVNFVLDDSLNKATKSDSDMVYQMINPENIGLFGHSIGGATAAQVGRERSDIDAVIVVDGTMLGEWIGFDNGTEVLNSDPYPVPLLNIYAEQHYKDAIQNANTYANMTATKGAVDARQTVFIGAGHLNFTDLPIFSPFLASMLGTGNIDSRYCLKTLNQIVLEYFNYYLKDAKELNLKAQY